MYELTMLQSENCRAVAISKLKNGDVKLYKFWMNAAIGYKNKALSMTLEEAGSFYEN